VVEFYEFERLELTVARIAAHSDHPGQQELVREYLDVIEGHWREGRLSFVQWAGLVALLLAG
jgi:hypothetical protein